jgi:thiamine transport system permease protein
MAGGDEPLKDERHSMRLLTRRQTATRIGAGVCVLAAIVLVVGLAVAALLNTANGSNGAGSAAYDSYIWRVAGFTLFQAGLSSLLSVLPAIALARAIVRRPRFPGRRLLVILFAVPLGLPQIVAALGLIEIWGRQGLVNGMLLAFGMAEPVSIYGLSGILLAHVFFNLPLATRLLMARLEAVPDEYWRNAGQLGLGSRDRFRFIEWPHMRGHIAGVAGLVFMLCVTSFTLVLLLGGGPRATTIEVAIYQALRFDFDPPRAVVLALLQIVLTAVLLAVMALIGRPAEEGATLGRVSRQYTRDGLLSGVADYGLILLSAVLVVAPMVAIVVAGLSADLGRLVMEAAVIRAFATSLAIGFSAACLCVFMSTILIEGRNAALPFADASRSAGIFRMAAAGASSLILLVPPVVLGSGWFVLLRGQADVFSLAPVFVTVINALMALPFVMRVLEPAHANHIARIGRLSASLGLSGFDRLRHVDWPGLRRPLLLALAVAMALSLGDLGAIALFGSEDVTTLPYLLLQRMGSYRTADASGLALILGLVCLVLMTVATAGPGRRALP